MHTDFEKVRQVFLEIVDQPAAQWDALLDKACGNDTDLRQQVALLLQAHAKGEGILDRDLAERTPTGFYESPSEGPGTMIGPYKLLQQIGEGGMGTVFMAEQTQPVQRKVALKVIKPGMDSRQVIARFEAERQALALMDHVNIARVLDAGTTESGLPYFVMELVHGVPITRYCDDNRLTPRQRVELFVPVCQAIQHAHQKGIIHRDIKPSNVLVTLYDGQPVPKVIDFGVAKATEQKLTERTLFTQYGTMIGTLEYMSPEQAEMSALGVDTRSDIFSLGVLLYELLTGTTPLSHKRVREAAYAEVLRLIKEEEPPRPSTRLNDSGEALASISAQRHTEPAKLAKLVRGELDWIVMKCLEKDRNRRYETANGFAADVQRYLNDEAVEACPPSAGYRLWKFARRHKAAFRASAAFLGLLGLGVVVSTWQAVRATVAEKDARAAERAVRDERDKALAEKERANEEANIAAAVNDFLLNDLLAEAAPDQNARDQKVTVEELLGRASARVAGKFDQQPRVEAAIRQTIGDTYRQLGDYPAAVPHFERALEIRRRVLGEDHPDTLDTMNKLALAYKVAGKLDLALPLYQQTLTKRTAGLGPDHADTLTSMNNLARVYQALGQLDLALPLFVQTLDKRKATLGPDHHHTLISMSNLANAYREAGQLDLALPLYQVTLEKMTATLSPDHSDTLGTTSGLAITYQVAGKLDLALPLFQETLRRQTAKLGPDNPNTLSSMNNLARAYRDAGRLGEAESLFREAVTGARAKLGFAHSGTQTYQRNLAECYAKLRQPEKAEPLWRELAAFWKDKTGAESPQYAAELAPLGMILLEQQKPTDAEPLLRECLAIRDKTQPDAWTTFSTRSLLGGSLLDQKKYAEAEPLLLAGYEGLKQREAKMPESAKARLTDALERLVHLYEATGEKEKLAAWRLRLDQAKNLSKP
jgi:eukaryotic-like serine/threonine-protein kinase